MDFGNSGEWNQWVNQRSAAGEPISNVSISRVSRCRHFYFPSLLIPILTSPGSRSPLSRSRTESSCCPAFRSVSSVLISGKVSVPITRCRPIPDLPLPPPRVSHRIPGHPRTCVGFSTFIRSHRPPCGGLRSCARCRAIFVRKSGLVRLSPFRRIHPVHVR